MLSPNWWMWKARSALGSWPLMFHEMVVGEFSSGCSKVTVPVILESPRRTATGLVSGFLPHMKEDGRDRPPPFPRCSNLLTQGPCHGRSSGPAGGPRGRSQRGAHVPALTMVSVFLDG